MISSRSAYRQLPRYSLRTIFVHICISFLLLLQAPAASAYQARRSNQQLLDDDTQLQQLMVRAMTQTFLGYHEEAISLYEQALQIAPTSPTINSLLAESYESLENLSQAIYYAQQARNFGPEQMLYHQQLAELYIRHGEMAQAESTLESMLQAFPNHVEALEELAYLQFSTDQLDKALQSYRLLEARLGPQQNISQRILQIYSIQQDADGMEKTLIQLNELTPNNPTVKRYLSEIYADSDRLPEAIYILEEALRIDSSNVEIIVPLADLYEKTGDSSRARRLWDHAIDDSNSPEEMVDKAGRLYAQLQGREESLSVIVALLERALDQDPNLEEGLILLGNLRFEEKAYDEAGSLLYRAVQVNPRKQDVWLQAAAAYLRLDQPARAAEIADEALMLFPGQPSLLRVAAYGYMDAYDNQKAIDRFEEFYRLIENEPSQNHEARDILSALGLLYTRTRNDEAADSIYTLALKSFPDNTIVLNNYAYFLAEREESLDEALRYAQKAVKLDPSNASFLDTLGWVFFKMNRLQEAERWIRKAIQSKEASAAAYEHLGDIQARLGKSDEAIASWNKSLELNPANQALKQKLDNKDD